MPQTHIPTLVTADPTEPPDEKGLFSRSPREDRIILQEIPVDSFRQSLAELTESLALVIDDAEVPSSSSLSLREVTVSLEVTAEGGVRLIGTANLAAKAGITLTFRRGD